MFDAQTILKSVLDFVSDLEISFNTKTDQTTLNVKNKELDICFKHKSAENNDSAINNSTNN